MSKNYELDILKSREQEAFQQKQEAYKKYAEIRDRCNNAHDVMQSAWNERCSAREEMNHEYDELQRNNEHYREVWNEYGYIRDRNNCEIEHLRGEADYEHQQMIVCFERASNCYEYGDRAEAPYWAQQGHDHKERRNDINEQVSRLCQEIKSARQNAEWKAPKTNSSAFHRAKDNFERAKTRHESAQAEFKRLKAERDRLKNEFNIAQEAHVHLKEKLQKKYEEVKMDDKRERDKILDKAGINYCERDDAKIVKKADGTTQVYHGGIGKGDGYGHGHTALDQSGHKTYDRDAFEEHGHQNYTDDGKGFTMYDRRARSQTEVGGSGKENYIDVRTGKGHTTQWYKDGYRVSWDTEDNGKTEKAHWTNQNVPTGHPERHKKPSDANH